MLNTVRYSQWDSLQQNIHRAHQRTQSDMNAAWEQLTGQSAA